MIVFDLRSREQILDFVSGIQSEILNSMGFYSGVEDKSTSFFTLFLQYVYDKPIDRIIY